MKRLLKRLLLKSFLYVGLPALLLGGAYGWWAKSKLEQTLASDDVKAWSLRTFALIDRAESKVDSSFSRVFRAAVRRTDGANYRPYNQALVHDVYDWSPGKSQWVVVAPTLDESSEMLKLKSLEIQTPGQHIERLADANAHVREVASTLLHLRTSQDFGYKPELPPESQKEAIEKWRAWWEKNKLGWVLGKGLEAGTEILRPSKSDSAPKN